MKKLISLLLVIIMTCSTLVGCDWKSIFNPCADSNDTVDEELKMKEAYLSQFQIEGVEAKNVVVDYDGGTYNGARIVMLDAEWHNPAELSESIDDVTITYYDPNRLYVYQDESFISLNEAYSSSRISKDELSKIASDFNNDVRHFRDTCDKFDFPEFWIEDYDGRFEGDDYYLSTNRIYIEVDKDIAFNSGNTGWRENLLNYLEGYVGENVVKHIIFESRITWESNFYLIELHDDGFENIKRVFEILSRVPGILSAGYYIQIGVAAQANDSPYIDYNSSWWIDNIEVEKVWDFTTNVLKTHIFI